MVYFVLVEFQLWKVWTRRYFLSFTWTIIGHGCTTVGKYYYFTHMCVGQQRGRPGAAFCIRYASSEKKVEVVPARFRLVSSSHHRYVRNCVCYILIVITHALKTAAVVTYSIRIIIIIIITTYYVVKICVRIKWPRSCSRSTCPVSRRGLRTRWNSQNSCRGARIKLNDLLSSPSRPLKISRTLDSHFHDPLTGSQ